MAKVEAPNKEYNGVGPGGAVFKEGVATVTDEAALNYYRDAGYTVSGKTRETDSVEQVDSRDVTVQVVGTPLGDAAVNPREDDYLAPINAGQGDPHGPNVVSPEIHGSGPAGIVPGVVPVDNLGKQEQREKEFVERRLLNKESVVDASGIDLEERGPLGLSDPGSAPVADGDGEAGTDDTGDRSDAGDGSGTDGPPAKSANKPEWVDYAVAQGASRDDAEALTKDELVKQYS